MPDDDSKDFNNIHHVMNTHAREASESVEQLRKIAKLLLLLINHTPTHLSHQMMDTDDKVPFDIVKIRPRYTHTNTQQINMHLYALRCE